MKAQFHRIGLFAMPLLVLTITLASNVAPAQAAGSTILVDDDGLDCHTTVTTIQAAITQVQAMPAAARKKIVVCAGTYTGPFVINNMSNLKLMAKRNVTLEPPNPSPFEGHLIAVNNSTNVTVQGFTIDGRAMLGAVYEAAILYNASSGVIQKNTIVNWRTFGYAQPNDQIVGISVSTTAPQTVRILGNTISDSQSKGIGIVGPVTLRLVKNRVTATVASANVPYAMTVAVSYGGAPSGTISGNTLTSDAFPGSIPAPALYLNEVSSVKISGNTVTGWGVALYMTAYCSYAPGMDNVKVTGNKLLNNNMGIVFQVVASGTCDAHADNLRITGNKIINSTTGVNGVRISASGSNPPLGAIHNATVKGNTITNFTVPFNVTANPGGDITGIFAPNNIH